MKIQFFSLKTIADHFCGFIKLHALRSQSNEILWAWEMLIFTTKIRMLESWLILFKIYFNHWQLPSLLFFLTVVHKIINAGKKVQFICVLLMEDILLFSLNCVIFTILPIISYIRLILEMSIQMRSFFIFNTHVFPHQHSQWLILCDFLWLSIVFHNSLFPNCLMGTALLSRALLLLNYSL